MRSILVNTLTWILIACGAYLFVRGGLDYWQSKSAQQEIASEWNREQQTATPVPSVSGTTPPDESGATSPQTGNHTHASIPRAFTGPRQGAALAKLSIPRLNAVLYVVEGDDTGDLMRGPGHLIGSALPGRDGNCIIAGHRDTHFRVLRNVQKGDEILLSRGGETYRYRVDELSVISPDNPAPLRPSRSPVLNLITCYPFYYVGSAPRRFIVHAYLENSDGPLRASANPVR